MKEPSIKPSQTSSSESSDNDSKSSKSDQDLPALEKYLTPSQIKHLAEDAK